MVRLLLLDFLEFSWNCDFCPYHQSMNLFYTNAWKLWATVVENLISSYLSADILTYLYSADKSGSIQMQASFVVI